MLASFDGRATFVTIGSPLAISNLIFEKLWPSPKGGVGAWPQGIHHGNHLIDNGAKAHDAVRRTALRRCSGVDLRSSLPQQRGRNRKLSKGHSRPRSPPRSPMTTRGWAAALRNYDGRRDAFYGSMIASVVW